jgi:hypothetical protein
VPPEQTLNIEEMVIAELVTVVEEPENPYAVAYNKMAYENTLEK